MLAFFIAYSGQKAYYWFWLISLNRVHHMKYIILFSISVVSFLCGFYISIVCVGDSWYFYKYGLMLVSSIVAYCSLLFISRRLGIVNFGLVSKRLAP